GLVLQTRSLSDDRATQRAGERDCLLERTGQRLTRPRRVTQQCLALPLGQRDHSASSPEGDGPRAVAAYAATARSVLDKSGMPAPASSDSLHVTSRTTVVIDFPVRWRASTTPWPNSGMSRPQLITITPW